VIDLKVENRGVSDLIPYAANSRTHSDAQVAQIAASIKEFGWTNPILIDGDDTIIAGHGRLLAARKLGLEDVPVIVLDHLSKSQQRALIIADNQLALNAGWDNPEEPRPMIVCVIFHAISFSAISTSKFTVRELPPSAFSICGDLNGIAFICFRAVHF